VLYCDTAPIEEMNARLKAKQKFDPTGIFNPYNMFGECKSN
jgi:FAD/FMN-containing dehydrogenase